MASEAADVEQWEDLQLAAGQEGKELGELKSSQEQVQNGLRESQKLLEGIGKFTEDGRFNRTGGRLEGMREMMGPLGGIFGSSKSKAETDSTPARQGGPSNRIPNMERRGQLCLLVVSRHQDKMSSLSLRVKPRYCVAKNHQNWVVGLSSSIPHLK